MRSTASGYTLIETLTVIAIIAVVSGLVLANYSVGQNRQRLKQVVDGIVLSLNQAQQNALGGTGIKRCSTATSTTCLVDTDCPSSGVCLATTGHGVHFTNGGSTYDVFDDLTPVPTCEHTPTRSCAVAPDCPGSYGSDECVYQDGYGAYNSGDFLLPGDPQSVLTSHVIPADISLVLAAEGRVDEPNDTSCQEPNPDNLHITFQPPASNAVLTDVVDAENDINSHTCRTACLFVRSPSSGTPTAAWAITVRRTTGLVEYKQLANPTSTTCPPA